MNYYDIIVKKRDGGRLDKADIAHVVQGISDGTMPDYQVAAWAMTVYFQGMDARETRDLAVAMANSGEVMDLNPISGLKVDKHSTGGVGDKTTLVTIPIVAAAGVPVAKMSGRGLGHTGGTIDKFESIPGFRVELSRAEFIHQVNQIKAAVIAQSGHLVPADKRLYAIRDLTATVESIPLIASSIMSKKLASGANGIVLDVKVGQGAFMKDIASARILAHTMVDIGTGAGRKVVAVLTDMNQPLGRMIGNALEVQEALDTLRGNGPDDLRQVSLELAAYMIILGGRAHTLAEARNTAGDILQTGAAADKFLEMVSAQGGFIDINKAGYGMEQACHTGAILCPEAGFVQSLDALAIGRAAMLLGAGREQLGDVIDHAAGVALLKKPGDPVLAGDVLAVMYFNRKDQVGDARSLLLNAYRIGPDYTSSPSLIMDTITN